MQDVKKQAIANQYASTDNLSARIRFHERYNTNPENWWPWIFRQVRETVGDGPKEVLEIGCGRGDFWKRAETQVPATWKVRLTDASASMVNMAKSQNLQVVASIEQREAVDALSQGGDLDAVMANHMLYCLTDEDRKRVFEHAAHRLRTRHGHFFASTNGTEHVAGLWNIVFEFDPSLRPLVEATKAISSSEAFTKENGSAQLTPWFSKVEWREYGCVYQVDNADVFCDFVNSFLPIREALTVDKKADALNMFIQERLKNNGYIPVASVSGLFIARP